MRWFFPLCVIALLLLGSLPALAQQDLIDSLRDAEKRYGLPDLTLVALSRNESSLNWFAINFDDVASFYPKTKAHALRIIRSVSGRPYTIRVSKAGKRPEVYFFPTVSSAQRAASKVHQHDDWEIVEHSSGKVVEKLDLLNTGLCAMQLNFRWQAHEQGRSAKTLLDPSFCIEHAAKFVAGLIRKHGFEKGIGCYYTCGRGKEAQQNRREYFARYRRHLDSLASASPQIAQR